VKQYTALLETEGVKLEFTPEALSEIAHFAFRVNESTENIERGGCIRLWSECWMS
jgi:ATP-dependent HslUV protease ATP-binding subunit HslU